MYMPAVCTQLANSSRTLIPSQTIKGRETAVKGGGDKIFPYLEKTLVVLSITVIYMHKRTLLVSKYAITIP